MYLFSGFKDYMINAVSWNKLKLVSRNGLFFWDGGSQKV